MNTNPVSTVKLDIDSLCPEAASWIIWNILELVPGKDFDGTPLDCLRDDPEIELSLFSAKYLEEQWGVKVECPTCEGATEVGFNNTWNRDPQYDDAKPCECDSGIRGIADAFYAPTPEEFTDKWYGFDPDYYRD